MVPKDISEFLVYESQALGQLEAAAQVASAQCSPSLMSGLPGWVVHYLMEKTPAGSCKKSEMTRQRRGMADRARCRLPLGHKGAHQFADGGGCDVSTRAWKPEDSCEAYLRACARAAGSAS